MTDSLRILPLGGLGEIGMNMTLYGCGDDWFAVDAGVQFCDAGTIGAEAIIPDLDLLAEYRDRLKALIITHGHEDHIGAIEHVMGACPVPVYAPPFVCELIRLKHDEYGAARRPELRPIAPGQTLQIGKITIEFLRVTHSIPDCHALAMRTPVGIIVHTGDFKIDPDPLDGRFFDTDGFQALGDEGVRLLLSDSTNAEVPGHTRSEKTVLEALSKTIAAAPERVIIGLFASNMHRVRGLLEIAEKQGRRVALVGRSLNIYMEAARRTFQFPAHDFVDPHNLDRVPDRKLLILCTGSQAEARSVLYRASMSDHPDLRIRAGDTIILSSRIIPGNERPIYRMMNSLSRLGAHVLNERNAPGIHGSGHAHQDELKEMIRLCRPRSFIPIHGEFKFMQTHGELASDFGVGDVRLLENGHMLEVTREDITEVEHVPLTFHYVDGAVVGDAGELRLDERKRIGWTGVVAARLMAERGKKRWKARVDLQSVGVPLEGGVILGEAATYAAEEIAALPIEATKKQIEETLVGSLRSFFRRRLDRKPTVLAFVETGD